MSKSEWDRTGWDEQILLTEGLQAEMPWIGRVVMLQKAENPLDPRNGVFGPITEEDEEQGSAADLQSFGVRVNQSKKMTPVYRSVAD